MIHFEYDKEFHKTKRCPGAYKRVFNPQAVQKDTEEAPERVVKQFMINIYYR